MIDRYIEYLSAVRRYSPRTVEIYRSVLEEYLAFVSRTGGDVAAITAPGNRATLGIVRGGTASEAKRWGPALPDVSGGSSSLPGVPLPELLNVQTVRSYEVHLLDEKGESAKTVSLHLSVLSGFCRFLMKQGLLESNPVRLVSRPRQEKRLPVFYREESMQEYFEKTKGVLEYGKYEDQLQRMILGLLYGTGIRRAELISLKRNSIDFSRRVMRVLGKGDKIREIPLTASLCDEILLYLQSVDSLKCADKSPEAPLLQTPRGARLYPVFVDRAVKAALGDVAGISGRKSPHVLRHTLATELLDGGADLNSIKELLGHGSLAATQIYTHNSIERLQSVYKSAHPRAKNDGKNGD
ncbi:MAG: tyrosine-type recombinase/integrase [Bacteroidales bacterium]|nr:tyrosine-type recombinase/integrase [Bacteroidales bacterium]